MIPLPLIYALLVALEIAAPADTDVRMDVLAGGTLEYELQMVRDGAGWSAERIGDPSQGSAEPGAGESSGEPRLLFEVERSTRYGQFRIVYFPDRYPALFDLSSVSGQLLAPEPGERREITASPDLPDMGVPRAADSGQDGAGGLAGAGGSGAAGSSWTIISRRDGLYLTAPSLGRVIVVRR